MLILAPVRIVWIVWEAVFAMLACARLGAVHSVVFGGFAGPLGPDVVDIRETWGIAWHGAANFLHSVESTATLVPLNEVEIS